MQYAYAKIDIRPFFYQPVMSIPPQTYEENTRNKTQSTSTIVLKISVVLGLTLSEC